MTTERKIKRKQYDKKYRDSHKPQEKKRHAKYRREHREELRAKGRQYYKANRTQKNANSRRWNKNNPAKVKRSTSKWRKSNVEMYRCCCAAQNANREAKKYTSPGRLTSKQLYRLFREQNGICLCCRKHKQLGPDHVIPLSKGGSNRIGNIQGLCASCNKKKKDRTIDYRNQKSNKRNKR